MIWRNYSETIVFLRTPRAARSVPLVQQAALTTTKVPWFNGSTSWEQYLQVFDAIVLSNRWGDTTAALQLVSHLQDDVLSVALLIPMPLQATRKELTDARFIAGHENCDLQRYLDCVPPDTPLRDIVDRCRVWESHGTTEIRRVSKPIPEPVYPTYVVEQPDYESEPVCMVSVNKQNSQVDQTDELLRKLLEALTPVKPPPPPPPVRVPKSITLDKLSELLMSQVVKSEPDLPTTVEPTGLEAVLRTYFTGQQSTGPGPRGRNMRRDWSDIKCFSCGKPGHGATHCPTLDESFSFILPGWKAEKTPTGYLMISPKMAMDHRRAENED